MKDDAGGRGDEAKPEPPGGAAGPGRRVTLVSVLRALLGAGMIAIGVTHFVAPGPFLGMMPAALPWPLFLVYLSGAAEIAGGAGLFVPRVRRAASWGLIALYIAVFPANVNMALHDLPLGGYHLSRFALWARLPLQLVFIAWAYWVGRPRAEQPRG